MNQENILDNTYHEQNVVYAAAWQRFVALFIDGCLIWVVRYIVLKYTFNEYNILLSLLPLVYKPGMEYFWGATLGKMVLRLQVLDISTEPPTIAQVLLRNIIGIIGHTSNILLFTSGLAHITVLSFGEVPYVITPAQLVQWGIVGVCLIDFLGLVINKKRQALHDLLANTVVIKKQRSS